MHDTGCSGLVHWDDPEGWDGEGGGRGVQDGEHMYTRGVHHVVYIVIVHCPLYNVPCTLSLTHVNIWQNQYNIVK